MTINDPRDSPEYQVTGKGYEPVIKRDTSVADSQAVTEFHKKDDLDASAVAHHHTLGNKPGQASPGDHVHNGINGKRILAGTTITGSRASGAALVSVIAALVKLGAKDSTVA